MTRFRSTPTSAAPTSGAAREGVIVAAETALVDRRGAALVVGERRPLRPRHRRGLGTVGRAQPARAAATAAGGAARGARLLAQGGRFDVAAESRVLRYDDRDIHLDLGAIAKGYGIDRAIDALRARGIAHAIVTVGGDLYALGGSPEGEPWKVGIRDPHDLSAVWPARSTCADRAVTTSGDYERFFRYRGVRYHHLMDPVTGGAAAYAHSQQHRDRRLRDGFRRRVHVRVRIDSRGGHGARPAHDSRSRSNSVDLRRAR